MTFGNSVFNEILKNVFFRGTPEHRSGTPVGNHWTIVSTQVKNLNQSANF